MDIQGQTQEEDNPNVKQQGKQDSNQPKKRKCVCTVYKITRPGQTASRLPPEILRMDSRSIEVYKKALEDGSEKDYSIRLMVVGPYGVGKTTLTKRLLGEEVDITKRVGTNGIDIHVNRCRVSLKTKEWMLEPISKAALDYRMVKVIESTRTERDQSSGPHMGETFVKGNADELRTPYDSSEEKPELRKTTVVIYERMELNFEMPDKANVKEDPPSEVYTGEPPGSTQVGEDTILTYLKALKEAERHVTDDDHALVSIWDFGGQSVFYTTHQMFLSPRAIYILVINMSQPIESIMVGDKPYFDCCEANDRKIEEFLEIWMYSIHGQSKSEEILDENQARQNINKPTMPCIILVGTHRDQLDDANKEKEEEKIFDAIRNRFERNPHLSSHFIDKDFGLSNAEIDPRLIDLRQTVFEVAEQQSYWGRIKPAKWIPLEKVLDDLRSQKRQIISCEELDKFNQGLHVPIRSNEELEVFLRFQHEVGRIMYFSVPELKDKIVLDPQFLVDALKSLITADEFCKKKPGTKWKEFEDKGILTTDLLDAVWKMEGYEMFQKNREHILALMEHLNIIAKPVKYAEGKESGEDVATQDCIYLVPCVLKTPPTQAVLLHDKNFISTPCLCLQLENVAFPSAIFSRLLAGCISLWPLASTGPGFGIYCGCGQFDVESQHRLTLSFLENFIMLSITRFAEKHRDPKVSICCEVNSKVKQILERIGKILSLKEMKINEHVQCPGRQTVHGLCMHSVETLKKSASEFPCHLHDHDPVMVYPRVQLKYWFPSEETDHDFSSEDKKPSILPFEIASQIITDKGIVAISKEIGTEYTALALHLEITFPRIAQIRMQHGDIRTQIIYLLREWRENKGCFATYRELEKAMNELDIDTKTAFKNIL